MIMKEVAGLEIAFLKLLSKELRKIIKVRIIYMCESMPINTSYNANVFINFLLVLYSLLLFLIG